MKYATTLVLILPGAAFAHGGHAPMPAGAHEVSHLAPVLGLVIIAAAIGLAIVQRWRP